MSGAEPGSQPLPLVAQGIVKSWGTNLVLDGIDLTLQPGTITWVGGRNGVGKTTLLRILSGLIGADSGTVSAYGLDPFRNRQAYQRKAGCLSAGNTGIYARITVRQQLDLWARIAFIPRSTRTHVVSQTLDAFDLMDLADQRSDRLSMGQRQRMRIAMTFVHRPELVLLDEPRTSLDGEGGALLAAAIRATADRGGAVLWVSPTGEPVGLRFDQRRIIEHGKLRAA